MNTTRNHIMLYFASEPEKRNLQDTAIANNWITQRSKLKINGNTWRSRANKNKYWDEKDNGKNALMYAKGWGPADMSVYGHAWGVDCIINQQGVVRLFQDRLSISNLNELCNAVNVQSLFLLGCCLGGDADDKPLPKKGFLAAAAALLLPPEGQKTTLKSVVAPVGYVDGNGYVSMVYDSQDNKGWMCVVYSLGKVLNAINFDIVAWKTKEVIASGTYIMNNRVGLVHSLPSKESHCNQEKQPYD